MSFFIWEKSNAQNNDLKNKNTELASQIADLQNNSCPSGWIGASKLGCYFVASNRPAMSSYDHAKKFCQSLDKRAHLLEIRNFGIQEFIGKLDLSSSNYWWIGATDEQKVCDIFYCNFLTGCSKIKSIRSSIMTDFSSLGRTLGMGK